MLDELRVANLGIIAEAVVEPGSGFVVVTGETGAGKTLLLGAIRLLIGEKARRDQVGPAGSDLVVEGRFEVGGEDRVARRRVTAEGRSRAYLDGAMVPARTLTTEIGSTVELVAQHDAFRLASSDGVRNMVDGVLDREGRGLLADYGTAFAHLTGVRERQRLLGGDRRAVGRELDMVRFQVSEIASAGFTAGDDVDLHERAQRLRNTEAIAAELAAIREAVGGDLGARDRLALAAAAAGRLAGLDPETVGLSKQLNELAMLLDEVTGDIATRAADARRDPVDLDHVETRLATLANLQRKYGESLDEILAYGERAEVREAELTELIAEAETIDESLQKAETRVSEAGERLCDARRSAAERLATAAVGHLRDLGFADPVVAIDVTPGPAGPAGADRCALLFASDEALEMAPVHRIASGGELSRLVLALHLASGVADAPVVAFDEVDAGIGGTTALAMGRKLRDLAAEGQVLAVTHLPQVAAFAERHYVVRRSGVGAEVVRLEGAARLEELTRMLAGLSDSTTGREHAAELLEMARS